MKMVGGKPSKDSKSGKKQKKKNVSVGTPYDYDPSYDVMGGTSGRKKTKVTTGKVKEKGSKKQGKKGRILLVFSILAFLFAGGAFLAVQFIKPPEIAVHENDKTIIDEENGDVVAIDPGQRISDYFTFLVCATDIDETRTDNMMVVGFDTKNHKVNVLNIPRDVMCANNKTGANRKINAAYGSRQDINNTKKEVKKIIGFTPDKYIVVNFKGIAEIVDAIGGITYEVPFKMIYNDPIQDLHIYFEPGVQKMNGQKVVEFLRWRHNDPGYTHLQKEGYDGGDESRIAKQQEFLMHVAKQILKPENIFKAKPIAQAIFSNVKTDLTMGELVWMANQAMQVDTSNIQMFTLPGYPASSYAGTNAFLSFFFPNESKTLALINEHFNPYDKKLTSLDVIESPPEGTRRPGVTSDEDEEEIIPPKDPEQSETENPESGDPEQSETENPENPDSENSGSGNHNDTSGQAGSNDSDSSNGSNDSSGSDSFEDPNSSGSQTPPSGSDDLIVPIPPTDSNTGDNTAPQESGTDSGTSNGGDMSTMMPEPTPEPEPVPPDTTIDPEG